MIRRDFLRRLTATAVGLLVADDALELLLEPRRKLWAGADLGSTLSHTFESPLPVGDLVGGSAFSDHTEATMRRLWRAYAKEVGRQFDQPSPLGQLFS